MTQVREESTQAQWMPELTRPRVGGAKPVAEPEAGRTMTSGSASQSNCVPEVVAAAGGGGGGSQSYDFERPWEEVRRRGGGGPEETLRGPVALSSALAVSAPFPTNSVTG